MAEIDQQNVKSDPERIMALMDDMEKRVESFRRGAKQLEQEKADLLQCLHDVSQSQDAYNLQECDREDLEAKSSQMIFRCLTVNISVDVPRDEFQEKALLQARTYIESIKSNSKSENFQNQLCALVNACASEPIYPSVPLDQKFQNIILGCAAEDQKSIHRYLKDFLKTLSANQT